MKRPQPFSDSNFIKTQFVVRIMRRTKIEARARLLEVQMVLAVLFFSTNLAAQESLSLSPVALERPVVEKNTLVELTHGMTRDRVIKLLGTPDFESIVGSLQRARVDYGETELLFEDNRLIALKSAEDPLLSDDGRLAVDFDGTKIIYTHDLVLPEQGPLPVGEERRPIDDEFYFAPSNPGDDEIPIPFTPSMPPTLLDTCGECGSQECGGCGAKTGDQACGLDSCGDVPWTFRFSIDALFLARDLDEFSVALTDVSGPVQTERLSHGLTPGLRARGVVNLTGSLLLEGVYLGAHQWETDSTTGNLVPASGDTLAAVQSYEARLDDYQINVIHRGGGGAWGFLWGLRYSDHRDSFSLDLSGQLAGPPVTARNPLRLQGRTQNQMIGLQLGADRRWTCGAFELFGSAKLGVLHNETEQTGLSYSGSVDVSSNPASIPTFLSEDEEVSAMGDFEVSLRYRITENVAASFGYQGLVFSEMVNVANQNGLAADPDTLSYHGIFVGLEMLR
ncbi:MAG: BBP7 family outer membrane beta-barrel protein [Planctomycetota bacterium]